MGLIRALADLIGLPDKKAKGTSAGVYQVNGRVIVFSFVTTDQGISLHARPIPLRMPFSRKQFAAALATSTASWNRTVPHPAQNEWARAFAPFLKAAGVRSHKAFMQTAQLVDLAESGDGYMVQPWKNLGSKGGFAPDAGAAFTAGRDLNELAEQLAMHFGIDMIS